MTTRTPTDPSRRLEQIAALHWVGESGEAELYTLLRLREATARAAAALAAAGVRSGDPVEVFLPTLPESVVTALACERLGARAVLPDEGFSARSLRQRVRADGARVVVTADAAEVGGATLPLKSLVDRALRGCARINAVLVVQLTARPVGWTPGRDRWWDQALAESGSEQRRSRMVLASATSSSSNSF